MTPEKTAFEDTGPVTQPATAPGGVSTTADAGAAPDALTQSLDGIAETMGRMRMMMGRRFMSRIALSRLEAGQSLELSHFDVIKIVSHAARDQEVTVGVIAEQMRIDPSRASRVVADLVRRGALRREASQADARRTIVALTDTGRQVLSHFEAVRREVIGQTLADWSPDDITLFETLFDRFISGLECRGRQLARDVGLADKDASDGER